MKYVVTLTASAPVSGDYIKLGESGYRDYSETMFRDVHNKLLTVQTGGRAKAGFTTYKLINKENIEATYTFASNSDDPTEAAAEAYNWILSWKNTHGQEPEVNVYPYNPHKSLREQFELPASTETPKTQPEQSSELAEARTEVRRPGRPPIKH